MVFCGKTEVDTVFCVFAPDRAGAIMRGNDNAKEPAEPNGTNARRKARCMSAFGYSLPQDD